MSEKRWVGEVSYNGVLTKTDKGRLTIWKTPSKDRHYTIGVDPSGGSVDEAVISVIDSDSLEQCAEWAGVLGSVELAKYVLPLGLMYGGADEQALIAPETTGGWGISLLNELDGKYWNIYKFPRFDTLAQPDTNKLGFETNVRTKPLLVDFGEFCFNNDYVRVNSSGLLKEMTSFMRNENSAAGKGTSPDNRVMAWLIALFVAGSGRSDLRAFSSPTPQQARAETPEEEKNRKYFGRTLDTQCDLDYMSGADSDSYQEPRSWSEL
jgi:hypothetical protein